MAGSKTRLQIGSCCIRLNCKRSHTARGVQIAFSRTYSDRKSGCITELDCYAIATKKRECVSSLANNTLASINSPRSIERAISISREAIAIGTVIVLVRPKFQLGAGPLLPRWMSSVICLFASGYVLDTSLPYRVLKYRTCIVNGVVGAGFTNNQCHQETI